MVFVPDPSSNASTPTASGMTLFIQRGDAAAEFHRLEPSKAQCTFSFGTPSRRSAIWNIVVAKKGEVYVMERTTGQSCKVSFHKSGDWRFSFHYGNPSVTRIVEEVKRVTGSRILDQWRRPKPDIGNMTTALRIFTYGEDIRSADPSQAPADTQWIPAPECGETAFVSVLFMRPATSPSDIVEMRGAVPLFVGLMKTGEAAAAFASKRQTVDEEKRHLVEVRSRINRNAEQLEELGAGDRSKGMRAMVLGSNDAGIRHILDLAA